MTRRGFTLIELLISMAILAILSTIGFANFTSTRIKANDVKRKSDLSTIAKSLEAYVNDHHSYPLSDSDGKIKCLADGSICDWGTPFTDGTSTYAAILPRDESGGSYIYSSNGSSYTLYARLENTNDPSLVTGLSVTCGTITCNYKVSSSNIQ